MDKFPCKNECGKVFNSRQNRYKHETSHCSLRKVNDMDSELQKKLNDINVKYIECCYKLQNSDNIINMLKLQNEELKKELSDIKSQSTSHIDHIKTTGTSVIKLAQNSNTAIKHLTKHISDVPILTHKKDEIMGYIESERTPHYTPYEYIIMKYREKGFISWISDIIVAVYKGDTISEQQIWTTDPTRFTCIIGEIIENAKKEITTNKDDFKEEKVKKKTWTLDKGGKKVTKLVIKPTLEEIRKMMEKYIKYLGKVDPSTQDSTKNELMIEYIGIADKILKDIDNEIFSVPILKILACELDFTGNKHKIDADLLSNKIKRTDKKEPRKVIEKSNKIATFFKATLNSDDSDYLSESSDDKKYKKLKKKK